MSENIIERLTEMLAEINCLRETIDAENERLRARIAELEAEIAIRRGTLASSPPADDAPGNYTHDVAPSAPR
jgi:cell division septum initiation protein DivIVA